MRLYSAHPDLQIIDKYYHQNAKYEDGTISVQGKEDIKRMFRGTSLMQFSVKVTKRDVTEGEDKLVIDMLVETQYRFIPLLRTVRRVVTIITIKGGLVAKHEDLWSFSQLISDLPVMGYLYDRLMKPAAGIFAERVGQFLQYKEDRHSKRFEGCGNMRDIKSR